jgi:hypothetical protein
LVTSGPEAAGCVFVLDPNIIAAIDLGRFDKRDACRSQLKPGIGEKLVLFDNSGGFLQASSDATRYGISKFIGGLQP